MNLVERCARIDALVLDVDGVLTDGRIVYTDAGAEIKAFHVRDGSGLKLWELEGKKTGILTGRKSSIVERRAQELGIVHVVQGAADKKTALGDLLKAMNVPAERVAAIGDDIVDVPVLRACGLAIAVADAGQEAKDDAHYVTKAKGGRGAVREAIELILTAQGRWQAILERYRAK
jgi:3-deoxy-D-manno-octulosonate 8-phosphate phosphatase (KDO 8-P phosphatase)